MRCYLVRVHGGLDWRAEPETNAKPAATRPAGFFCHRYVLAADEERATAAAFRRVRENLDDQTGWLRNGLAALHLEAEEVATAPMRKLLWPDNKAHTFYERDKTLNN